MKLNRSVRNRLLAFLLIFGFLASPMPSSAATGTAISGRILDAQGGLPVQSATIELDLNGTKVATTTTDASGSFSFLNEPPGNYGITIRADGYQTTRAPELLVAP